MNLEKFNLQFFADEETKVEKEETKEEASVEEKKNDNNGKERYIAEGARKAEQNILAKFGVKSFDDLMKKDIVEEEPKQEVKEEVKVEETPKEQETVKEEIKEEKKNDFELEFQAMKKELEQLKASKRVAKFGVGEDKADDVVALCIGKGLPLTDENLKSIADSHPEWQKENKMSIGTMGGNKKTSDPDDKADARKLFGL